MKRLFALLLAANLVLLAGCVTKPVEDTREPTQPSTQAPTVETTVAPTEPPCVHQWELDESKPHTATCTADGQEFYKCRLCGEGKAEGKKAYGHSWARITLISGNCDTGRIYEERCRSCGGLQHVTVPAGEHTPDWENPGRTENPTCTEDGFQYAYCTVCGDRFMKELPATGHTPGEDGKCTVCGE